jgi:hypothetical protein
MVPYLRVSCYERNQQMSYLRHRENSRSCLRIQGHPWWRVSSTMSCVQVAKSEDNMTVFVDYMDKLARATGNTVHWGKVSDASRPLVRAVFQVPQAMFVPQVLRFCSLSSKVMGQCGTNSGFQAGTWQESRASMPPMQKQLKCPLRTNLLSKFTNMDIGQREFGGWLPVGINKFVVNTALNTTFPHDGRSRR